MFSKNNLDKDTLSIIFQGHLANYETILNSDQNMDTKNGVLIGGVLAFSAIVFQKPIIYLAFNAQIGRNYFLESLLILGILLLLSALSIGFIAVWPRLYNLPSILLKEQPHYVNMKPSEVTYQMIADLENVIEFIKKRLKTKGDLFKFGLICFAIASIFLIIVQQSL